MLSRVLVDTILFGNWPITACMWPTGVSGSIYSKHQCCYDSMPLNSLMWQTGAMQTVEHTVVIFY